MAAIKQGMEQKLQQKLSPLQIQTIKLIEMPVLALEQHVREVLADNPVIDDTPQKGDSEHEVSISEVEDFWCSRTLAGLATMELFWGGEQCPAPTVFAAMFVCRINKIFRNDPAGNLQTSDITIEPTAHLRPVKATGSPQFTGDQRPLLLQCE